MCSEGYGSLLAKFLCVCLCVCVCVCVCLSVCYHASEDIAWLYSKMNRLFSVLSSWLFKKPSVQKLWREKANILMSICLPRPPLVLMQSLNFGRQGLLWFFQSLAVGYTLPGILVRQQAINLCCTQLYGAPSLLRSLPYTHTLSLTCAHSQRACAHAHAQILAPTL